jgi:hypothetical protein
VVEVLWKTRVANMDFVGSHAKNLCFA